MDDKYLKILMEAYVDNFKRSCNISDVLENFNIYFTDENEPLVRAVEKIFFDYADDLCSCLLDFAWNGEVKVTINDKDVICCNIDEIYSAFFG